MVKVRYNNKSKKWEELEKNSREGFYLDGYLKKVLDSIKKDVKKDWDFVFLIDGLEGSGKSTLALTCGYYLADTKFSIKNIAVDGADALKKLEVLPDKSILVIDEAGLSFSSRDSMRKEQRHLTRVLTVVRQKNMVLILSSPSFFDLSKYISVDRSQLLFHVYAKNKIRGRWAMWGRKKKRLLYTLGKKDNNSYARPRARKNGSFTSFNPLDKEEYKALKRKSLESAFKEPKGSFKDQLTQQQRDFLIYHLVETRKFSQSNLAKLFNNNNIPFSKQNISVIVRKMRENDQTKEQNIV